MQDRNLAGNLNIVDDRTYTFNDFSCTSTKIFGGNNLNSDLEK